MDSLRFALERLANAEAALKRFRESFYMPWEGDAAVTAEERRARETLYRTGLNLAQDVQDAQKELVSVARKLTLE